MESKSKLTTDEKAEVIETTKLIPDPRNAKKHDEAQIAQIAGSIREFGFAAPIIIDESNNILAGHGRWMAAQKLELPNVPCRRLAGLSKAQKRAFVIADNKLTLNSGFDEEMLKVEFEDLPSELLALTGFSEDEVKLCLDGWNSDIETPYADPTHTILKVRVANEIADEAKAHITKAMDASDLDYEWKE